MASTLRFDNWEDSNGTPILDGTNLALPSSALPAGSVLQVVRATQTSAQTTTSTSWVDANLSVSITPASTASNFLIFCTFQTFIEAGNPARAEYQIANVSNNSVSGASTFLIGQNSTDYSYVAVSLIGFDSPASTSSQTYKLQFESNAGGTVTIASGSRGPMQIIAMEIAG